MHGIKNNSIMRWDRRLGRGSLILAQFQVMTILDTMFFYYLLDTILGSYRDCKNNLTETLS